MKVPQITLFAKRAGVETTPYVKRSDRRPQQRCLALRFLHPGAGGGRRLTVHTIVHTLKP